MTSWDRLVLVSGPALPVSVADMRDHLRITDTEQDALVSSVTEAAAAMVEGPYGYGIALGTQTWDYYLDAFDTFEIVLPLQPVQSVTSITYTDADGNTGQTVSSGDYEVDAYNARVRPVSGASWPSTDTVYNAVKVRFVCGHTTIPADLKGAVKLLAGHLYENTEAVGASMAELPLGARTILEQHRRARFY